MAFWRADRGTNNYNVTPDLNAFFWTTIGLILVGGLITVIGGIVQFAAWIGALLNSYLLPEKTWFIVVLLGGVLSFAFGPIGFAAMLAYVVAAPDGAPYRQEQVPTAPQPTPVPIS